MRRINILLSAILFSTLLVTSCEKDIFYIEGRGEIVTETLDIDDFTGISMLGAEDVEISYGEVQEVVVTGNANIIERIKTKVYGGVWDMELERGNYRDYELKYFITLPQLNLLENDGAAKVLVHDFINNGDLEIIINGAGDIELNRMENSENMFVTIDGAGHVKANGEFPSLKYLDILITGAGEYKGFSAETNECRIEIDGTAKCEVSVENLLEVYIDGAGVVLYKGSPTVSQHISGLGVIESQN